MDLQYLLRYIELQIANSEEETHPYMIRFHDTNQYHKCVLHFKSYPDVELRKRIQTLPFIHALRCKLKHPDELLSFQDAVDIEPDDLLQLDSKFMLPSAGKPFTSVDPSERIPWGLAAIRAPKLWTKSRGSGVRIGIVDTGIDFNHPDIRSSIARGINLLNRYQQPMDDNGHGTHIAGTIVASNPVSGIRGIAPLANLYPVKAFDHEGAAYVSDIIQAIQWCVVHQMDIINMSFGMKQYSPSLHQAVKSAYSQDVVIVASSGNNGRQTLIDYPARFPQTVAVGATNKGKHIASFSNKGEQVDLYAPGEAIYSTWLHSTYNVLSGTSMATAHVSGVIALLLAQKRKLSASRIKAILTSSAVPLSSSHKKLSLRKGRLDAIRAWSIMYKGELKRKKTTAKISTTTSLRSEAKKKPRQR